MPKCCKDDIIGTKDINNMIVMMIIINNDVLKEFLNHNMPGVKYLVLSFNPK